MAVSINTFFYISILSLFLYFNFIASCCTLSLTFSMNLCCDVHKRLSARLLEESTSYIVLFSLHVHALYRRFCEPFARCVWNTYN